ncbi:MAG: DNA repair protein RadC [Candidatus Latescibacterota bacterium]
MTCRAMVPTVAREARPSPISGICAAEMPRERLARHGPEALRDHELLAVILGTGYRGRNVLELARDLLAAHPRETLVGLGVEDLGRLRGIGAARAGVLVAAFELARRVLDKGASARPVVSCPADAMPFLTDIRDQRREFFVCLYLNARNQVIHKEVVSIGSLSASIVHPREVFQAAVQGAAASVVLAHNHPSGDVTPSKDDLDLTRRLVQAGEIMGIEILDHLIVGPVDFLSLKERGLL